MKNWFKKILVGSVICFATTVFCLPSEDKSLKWYREHYDELKESVISCVKTNSLHPILKDGIKTVSLAKQPREIRRTDKFIITIISGMIEQGQERLFALFAVHQDLTTFNTKAFILYTANDQTHMPSFDLLSNVYDHPYMKEEYFPKKPKTHIITTNVGKKGIYTQDWLFYNENEVKKIKLSFAPDGSGGTTFRFLD